LLPAEILWRRKEAFSDGVSKHSRSLYQIIQEYSTQLFIANDYEDYTGQDEENIVASVCAINEKMFCVNGHLTPKTTEQYYYRKIFETYYPGKGALLPYFWMPRYVNAKDASARTLAIY